MPRVVGIDHLVLSVGEFARSKEFYDKLLKFLGFKLKHDYADMAGWSNGKTLFWIAAADEQGRKHKYRKGDIGFHHYAFELASRKAVDELGTFLENNGMTVVDPPGEYYGRNYYAVYFTDPDGMKLEGMIWAPPPKAARKTRPQRQEQVKRRPKRPATPAIRSRAALRARRLSRPPAGWRQPGCGHNAWRRTARDLPLRPDRLCFGHVAE